MSSSIHDLNLFASSQRLSFGPPGSRVARYRTRVRSAMDVINGLDLQGRADSRCRDEMSVYVYD